METIGTHPLIIVTKEDIKKTRLLYGNDDLNRMRECLDDIEEWCQTQPHLVGGYKYLGRSIIERLFLIAKGSVEGTKSRIDKLLTSRGMMPELVLNRSFKEFEGFLEYVNYIPLPKLYTVDQSRIMVTQFLTDKLDEFTFLSYFRYCFMLGEYRLNFDYSLSERYIIDLSNVHIHLLSKINPVVIKKAELLCTEGMGTKIKGIHILNAPGFVDKLMFLIKPALREKIANRIHIHSTYEDLRKHIPKEILPKDYGGDEQSCSKLAMQWKDTFKTEEARKILMDFDKRVSDETKRSSCKFNEEYMGMPGSFRKLTVD